MCELHLLKYLTELKVHESNVHLFFGHIWCEKSVCVKSKVFGNVREMARRWSIWSYNFTSCFIWVWSLASLSSGRAEL